MKNLLLTLAVLNLGTLAHAADPQGPVIEKCVYGEGEAEITVTIHKEIKKGAKKTADITHGTRFKRIALPIYKTPVGPEKSFAASNAAKNKTIMNISYGPHTEGSMNFDDDGTVFQTNELKCKDL